MALTPYGCAAAMLIALGFEPGRAAARHVDNEQDLLARIERESDPVKRSKFETRLGRVKLGQAIDACGQGDLDECQRRLGAYLERMQDSWKTLQGSGRRAARKPQGFIELDIELREDARRLEDLKRRMAYSDRDAVEKTEQGVERLRAEVILALFPGEHPAAGGKTFVCRAGRDSPLLERPT